MVVRSSDASAGRDGVRRRRSVAAARDVMAAKFFRTRWRHGGVRLVVAEREADGGAFGVVGEDGDGGAE